MARTLHTFYCHVYIDRRQPIGGLIGINAYAREKLQTITHCLNALTSSRTMRTWVRPEESMG
jgi:hypothetical protein